MENPRQTIHFQAPSLEELNPLFHAYDLEAFIAQGGMGAVYKARQISLDRHVAIKILPKEFGEDPSFRASFEAEAKAMARLNHPNLIGIYDFGEVKGMLFLVMEFVEGKSLFHSSYGKIIDPRQAAEIVIAICRGLDHAHSAGILHRDVKPGNILLSPSATPKIGDFGLASPINETASAEDVVYGTPGYTAPEIIHRLQVDRRADIFSTGVILHELLTGALPDKPPTSPSILSGCPAVFDTIVARSTRPDPQQRYATAGEFADDLERALKAAPAPARLNLTKAPRKVTATPLPTPPEKSYAQGIALTVIAIAAIGLTLYLFNQSSNTPDEPSVTVTSPPPATPLVTPPVSPPVTPPTPPEKPPLTSPQKPTIQQETPRQALARLKQKLTSGARDEFPDGTVERNGSHFLLLKLPVTWQTAIRYAEDHDGHLAIAVSQEDKQWLNQTFSIQSPIWLGAGIASREQWQWLDNTPWNPGDKPAPSSDQHRFATLTPDSTIAASTPAQTRGFILQWRNDGSNPCTLDAQLKRTTESINTSGLEKARYPVGTRTFQKSHFLITPETLTWENAYQFAKSNKAQLAVPSTPVENQWIIRTFSMGPDPTSYWLGGYLLKPTSPWQWTTQEAWHSSGWKSGEPHINPAYNRLLMAAPTPDTPPSWTSSQGGIDETHAILIEWSQPIRTTVEPFELNPWLATVNRKIKDRVKPDVDEYKKNHEQLIDKYIRHMKRAAKKLEIPGLPGGKGKRGGRRENFLVNRIESAMDDVKESGELPEDLPEFTPAALREIHETTKKSLEKLNQDYQAKLKTHLDFYTEGLLKKITLLEQSGFYQAANILKKSEKSIGQDTSKFLDVLGL